jgi:hypothetical protein
MNNGRVTMAVLATKLDQNTAVLNKLLEAFEKHVDQDEAFQKETGIQVDRLEQIEVSRRWHIRALWGSAIAGLFTWIISKVS